MFSISWSPLCVFLVRQTPEPVGLCCCTKKLVFSVSLGLVTCCLHVFGPPNPRTRRSHLLLQKLDFSISLVKCCLRIFGPPKPKTRRSLLLLHELVFSISLLKRPGTCTVQVHHVVNCAITHSNAASNGNFAGWLATRCPVNFRLDRLSFEE